ncbi:STAS domain-containing protein [bacterium]|nr:STAS domain-containing protein [bacterium]
MFHIEKTSSEEVALIGRLDAAQAEIARQTFNTIQSTMTVDFQQLDYISSAGLGVLLMTQKRLNDIGHSLKLIHMQRHIRDLFTFAGFDQIFLIEP